jgi:putative restriction endonuclease
VLTTMKSHFSSQNSVPAAEPLLLRHWWVNHAPSERAQVDGSYLWLPKKNRNGSRNPSHQNMPRLAAGDIIFSCAAATIAALGFVLERALTSPMPRSATDTAPAAPTDEGWLVPVRFVALAEPLHPATHMDEIRPLLPARQSPLRVSGAANPSVYLAELPQPLAELLRHLLNGQVEECEERIGMEMDGQLAQKAIEEHIWQRTDIGARDRRQLVSAGAAQGIFRERLERTETACRVTGIMDRRYLQATHIKPWKDADDREKLDGANGLLLSPHICHLFDRGHISFADDGSLMISRHLNPYVRSAWGLQQPVPTRPFSTEQRVYLDYHRRLLFERIGGGRRSASEP